nr:northern shrimp nuclease [Chrysogorgia stellata]
MILQDKMTSMKNATVWTALVLTVAAGPVNNSASSNNQFYCEVEVADLPSYPPFAVEESSGAPWLPELTDGQKLLTIPSGNTLFLSCPGTRLAELSGDTIEAKCDSGSSFQVDKQLMNFSNLGCEDEIKPEIREGDECQGTAVTEIIGWDLDPSYRQQISLCFNSSAASTLRAHHVINGSAIDAKQSTTKRPNFHTGGLYTFSMEKAYKQKNQVQQLIRLLGSEEQAHKFIDDDPEGDDYLSKGHLAAYADFAYNSWEDATCYYVNTAPQWQAFNTYNWADLEGDIRELAVALERDLHVYTGTHEVLELPDVNGNLVEIYLHTEGGVNMLPAPRYFWKVIYDPSTAAGVAAVGVNNPYLTTEEVESHFLLCSDICSDLTWLTHTMTSPDHGYIYCCPVDDLANVIQEIPDLDVKSILT